MIGDNKAHYNTRFRNALSLMITTLMQIRDKYEVNIDEAIRASDLVGQHIPEIKRSLLYFKNTFGDASKPPTTPPTNLPPTG